MINDNGTRRKATADEIHEKDRYLSNVKPSVGADERIEELEAQIAAMQAAYERGLRNG